MFKKEIGEGFTSISSIHIEQAKTLLQEPLQPIAEICWQVGNSDQKHFLITFKKTTNLNPGQYSRMHR